MQEAMDQIHSLDYVGRYAMDTRQVYIFGENALFDLYDMNGVMVKKACTREDLYRLTSGFYILTNGESVVKIVIKN